MESATPALAIPTALLGTRPQAQMDHTARLPFELLASIIGHLTQPDVLRAAALCTQWRGPAKDNPNYYCPLSFNLLLGHTHVNAAQFERDAQDAERCSFHVRLWDPDITLALLGVGLRILRAIKEAMPRTVKSTLDVHYSLHVGAVDTLSAPAPLLRELAWKTSRRPTRFEETFTFDLFASMAPNLTEVRLEHVPVVFSSPPCVLASVTRFECAIYNPSYDSFAKMTSVFPNMVDLRLTITKDCATLESLDPRQYDAVCFLPRLRRLSLALFPLVSSSALVDVLQRRPIPSIDAAFIYTPELQSINFGPLMSFMREPLHVTMHDSGMNLTARVSSATHGLTRSFTVRKTHVAMKRILLRALRDVWRHATRIELEVLWRTASLLDDLAEDLPQLDLLRIVDADGFVYAVTIDWLRNLRFKELVFCDPDRETGTVLSADDIFSIVGPWHMCNGETLRLDGVQIRSIADRERLLACFREVVEDQDSRPRE